MPSAEEIASQKERLYESSSLRDDLNDSEATVLLDWAQGQIDRLAEEFPDNFEKQARFLRQLLKAINRFVGQREFNEMEGQAKYMGKIIMYLKPLGWDNISADDVFAILPDDKADMASNLTAILAVLSPSNAESDEIQEDTPGDASGNITENNSQVLGNYKHHSINQAGKKPVLGDETDYGEE